MVWSPGDVVARREILQGRPWLVSAVRIVQDRPELLVSYLPEGAPFVFPEADWPTPSGRHPWHGRGGWEGHGVLMLQRPGESYAVWHFWHGAERRFTGHYLNLQEPYRRTAVGYDTQDLELDIWIPAGGRWELKDDDVLEDRVSEGRFTAARVREIRALGAEICAMLDAGGTWWDPAWTSWTPDPAWTPPRIPGGWATAATSP